MNCFVKARRFFREELEPNIDQWEKPGNCQTILAESGRKGISLLWGAGGVRGPGADFLYNMVLSEEVGYAIGGASVGFSVSSDIVSYYLLHGGSEAQKQRWLPSLVSGEAIAAIGMTEPGCGSDLKAVKTTAVRDGDQYVINGQKTFITNGQNCDFVLLVCSTDRQPGPKGSASSLLKPTGMDFHGVAISTKLARKPQTLLRCFSLTFGFRLKIAKGREGGGFGVLMNELPRERITIACRAFAGLSVPMSSPWTMSKSARRSANQSSIFRIPSFRWLR